MFSRIDHKAVEALLHGQGCANNLKMLLENREIGLVWTEPLLNSILDSFSLVLSSFQNMGGHVSERSSKKKICGIEGIESYRDESPTPRPDDGFTWRKYGQKPIKDSLHQRCYYRCTYAKDRNCNATKRVQKIQDNPPVYRTTYLRKHVCKDFAVHDDTYGSEMIQFDQVVSKQVMPQLTTMNHQAITMEEEDTYNIQECDINDYLVDDDQFWANQFPPFPSEDPMFF
ncbi:hypothetical protein CARUB_v10021860mg [Capsella rubella]|uniref:WRKY domain-containing protein n=1 Tax=Capsella rubella TaxID=81985 RepID=R0I8A6_9BRAS|nr:probable WRKY transcription factor 64 [Capsella rubella]EOA34340.1 hypothetical protein CARUB_v10021860mg [Capsella rubella]